ncbi:DUF3524 domain-containing protein [Chloroflexia bacterium SDU3-3]|nr:DUF3524 domain-containing protein [Chloroflexia bacterium SDU3-3]
MRILFLDPFHGGSHAAVSQGYAQHSQHEITLLTMPINGGWRWRMRGAAVTMARMLRQLPDPRGYDLIVTTDMLDLASFLGLARGLVGDTPVALYIHENQLTYPLPQGRSRDLAFPWANYTAALAADAVFFNSAFHRQVFLEALPGLVGRFHDHQELDLIEGIAARSGVLHPGVDLARLAQGAGVARGGQPPALLWNSRWEYDKNPAAFFAALEELERRGVDFRLIVVGEHIDPNHADFLAARERFGSKALAWGFAPDTASYARLLHQADIVVSTAIQEFFGISLIEAMYCGCVPIAPQRLSYTEVVPATLHTQCLYRTDAELADRLAAAIGGLPEGLRQEARSSAAAYDWAQMAPRYDSAFAAVARRAPL